MVSKHFNSMSDSYLYSHTILHMPVLNYNFFEKNRSEWFDDEIIAACV